MTVMSGAPHRPLSFPESLALPAVAVPVVPAPVPVAVWAGHRQAAAGRWVMPSTSGELRACQLWRLEADHWARGRWAAGRWAAGRWAAGR